MLTHQNAEKIFCSLQNTTQLVLGDMVIDEMVYGHCDRLSREAPVVILRHHRTDVVLGGGANAVHNVAAYGAKAYALGVWGNDYYAPQLQQAMQAAGIHTQYMLTDAARPTTTKTRISGMVNASVTQQMLRLDRESRAPLSTKLQQKMLQNLSELMPNADGLLLSDYGLGVVTPELANAAIEIARQHGKPVAVDSQQDLRLFQHASIITPNQPEAEKNVGFKLDTREAVIKAGKLLLAETQAENILITLGAEGMALFEREAQRVHFIPVFNRSEVFDVTGAGDTVVATWLVARSAGASPLEAAVLGNLAASLVVRVFGSAVTSVEALRAALNALPEAATAEIEHVSL